MIAGDCRARRLAHQNRVLLLLVFLSACVKGTYSMAPPSPPGAIDNSVVVPMPRDSAWAKMVPGLGRSFFVINTLDRSSGLLNIDYTGEPGRYLDCGTYTSDVTDEGGKSTRYEFPAAKAHERFQVANGTGMNATLAWVTWQMALQGRANVVFESVGADQTRVTVTVRYVVTHTWSLGTPEVRTASFSTGQRGSTDDGFLTCYATGALEQDILDALTRAGS